MKSFKSTLGDSENFLPKVKLESVVNYSSRKHGSKLLQLASVDPHGLVPASQSNLPLLTLLPADRRVRTLVHNI